MHSKVHFCYYLVELNYFYVLLSMLKLCAEKKLWNNELYILILVIYIL